MPRKNNVTLNGTHYATKGDLELTTYISGTMALVLHGDDGGIDRLSVNLDAYGIVPPPGHILIPEGDGLEGIAAELERIGVVTLTDKVMYGSFRSVAHVAKIRTEVFA